MGVASVADMLLTRVILPKDSNPVKRKVGFY